MHQLDLLLVEDELALRSSLRSLFTKEGYRVGTAANGREALQWLDHQPVQLVLTDLRMPVMDGYQLIEHLSARPHGSQQPAVIVYSGEAAQSEHLTQYPEQGAIAAVLSKPADIDDLLATVSSVSSLRACKR
jgi:CheY-like chemotaxis protein